MTIKDIDVLQVMGEEHTLRTAKLMHMAIGSVLQKLGETNIEISTADIMQFGDTYRMEVDATPDGQGFRYRIIPIAENEPELPLEIISA